MWAMLSELEVDEGLDGAALGLNDQEDDKGEDYRRGYHRALAQDGDAQAVDRLGQVMGDIAEEHDAEHPGITRKHLRQ